MIGKEGAPMKILLLGSQHGNERLGDQLHRYIVRHRQELLPFVLYKLANPKAFRANVRFTEGDMNRQYATNSKSYEAKRARYIKEYIADGQFDLVLDLHTTTCQQPPCLIVSGIKSENKRFIDATSISKIVEMKHSLVQSSINYAVPQVVSVELHKTISKNILNDLCDDIDRYLKNKTFDTVKYVYEANDLILKSDTPAGDAAMLENFQLSHLGYYPVLVGENSYKSDTDYLGFKAGQRRLFKV